MEFIEKKFEDKLSQIPKEPGCQMAESQSTAGEILLPLLDRKLPRVLIASSYQTCKGMFSRKDYFFVGLKIKRRLRNV